jgi:hypothetical protein
MIYRSIYFDKSKQTRKNVEEMQVRKSRLLYFVAQQLNSHEKLRKTNNSAANFTPNQSENNRQLNHFFFIL